MSRTIALQLIDELRAAGRISTVEAKALNSGLTSASNEQDADHWLIPRAFDAESLRTWVRRICVELEITPSNLARSAGLHSGSLNDFLRDERLKGLNTTSIEGIINVCRLHLAAPVEETSP